MGRIFLAPEYRWYFLGTAPLGDTQQFCARMADLVAPEFILPSPGRLDKEQVGLDRKSVV